MRRGEYIPADRTGRIAFVLANESYWRNKTLADVDCRRIYLDMKAVGLFKSPYCVARIQGIISLVKKAQKMSEKRWEPGHADIKLLPCPFCGSKVFFKRCHVVSEYSIKAWKVECTKDGCIRPATWIDSKFELAKLWNRRGK